MQTSVLLSIKPEFAYKIFQGTKKYEFRRVIFKNRNVSKVIVYASAPVSKVIGEFEIIDVLKYRKEHLWHRTKRYSGIEKEYFDFYFQDKEMGYAIRIGATQLYKIPLCLRENFDIDRAPQSFVYVIPNLEK